MNSEKMVAAITKVVGKEIEIKKIDEQALIVEFKAEDGMFKAQLQERQNRYGAYYRMVVSEPIEEENPEFKIDKDEALANLNAAKILSAEKGITVWVMSNGKRTAIIKTEKNFERHQKQGYWVAQIFENGNMLAV